MSRQRFFRLMLFVFLCMLNTSVIGGTIYVPGDYATIQGAINAASTDDVIIVDPNTYYESIDFGGKAITLTSTDPYDWDIISSTIIDADDVSAAVVTFDSGEEPNSILMGFTIQGAYSDSTTAVGISCDSSSPTISNCVIKDNDADISCVGVVCNNSSNAVISNCIINNNGDSATSGYGLLCVNSSNPTIRNCIVDNNHSGGILVGNSSSPSLTNCTVASNGLYGIQSVSCSPVISNCILWDNGDDLSGCSATYSCIEDGDVGTGNIDEDPYFVDADNGDYSLDSDSPCIDAADGDEAPETDIDGYSRYDDPYTTNTGVGDPNYVDIGAYEYQP